MVTVEQLTFDYSDKRALNNVSFALPNDSITALVGPNGAGKTTLLRLMAGLENVQTGSIAVNGHDVVEDPRAVHRSVGYLQDLFGLYDHLTVHQSLQFIAYSRLPETADHEQFLTLAAERTDLIGLMGKRVSTLSRGMKQRLGIAQAILHRPPVLLLDEPASGLDPEARINLSQLLLNLQKDGMTIVVSSHILAELQDYSSHMIVLEDGLMIEHRELGVAQTSSDVAELIMQVEKGYLERISAIAGVITAFENHDGVHIVIDRQHLSKHDLLRRVMDAGVPVEGLSEARTDLNEAYLQTIRNYRNAQRP